MKVERGKRVSTSPSRRLHPNFPHDTIFNTLKRRMCYLPPVFFPKERAAVASLQLSCRVARDSSWAPTLIAGVYEESLQTQCAYLEQGRGQGRSSPLTGAGNAVPGVQGDQDPIATR